LAEALEDALFALRELLGPKAYPQGAQDILLSTADPSVVATRPNKDYIKFNRVARQTMRYSSQVKPISYLKANAAEVLAQLTERREPLVITQNGEAKAVIQDVASYEETQETLALLKILALGNAQIEVGKVKPAREVVARLRAK
jgi:prevent-host-death family protein